MTRNEKKKWLSRYWELKETIDRETRDAEFWLEKAKGLTALKLDPTGVRGSSKSDPSYRYVLKCSEVADKCNKLIDEAKIRKIQIKDAIDALEDTSHRLVLTYRYVEHLNFYQIAVKLNYTLEHVWRLHREAVDLIETV